MPSADLVGPSRDGDQFHYVWAARRCLNLLPPTTDLVAITIEGSSGAESQQPIVEGEELIDTAEYFGSEELSDAKMVRYVQLKHSTLHPNDVWQPSELEHTLSGFAKRFRIVREYDLELELIFVSNRPINPKILRAVEDAALGRAQRQPIEHQKLKGFTGLDSSSFSEFCSKLKLCGDQPNLWDQRGLLFDELCQFLPGVDSEAGGELKELIARKAGSDGSKERSIRRADVVRTLKTTPEALYPAACQIEKPESAIIREGIHDILEQINQAGNRPVLLHAAGGVGKSVATLQIASAIPVGSKAIVYDCFGNGDYRNRSKSRHRAKEGLVQISNELAGLALCNPLIPTLHSDSKDFLRTCLSRLDQAAGELQQLTPDALLYVFVDAADNAETVARDFSEEPSFIRDLLRESIPDGVRLIAVCRTYRRELLMAPPETVDIPLLPFTVEESATYLRQVFPDALDHDVQEFHRLTSSNPRVQSIALSQEATLDGVLRSLGDNPTDAEDTIKLLFERAVAGLRDPSRKTESAQIDAMCAGLAVLRPLIPITVLAKIAGVDETAVESFAIDLGHPLRLVGGHLQFTDEPAESWFRDEFRPSGALLTKFIKSLLPLALTSTYVSSVLPQLMMEAEMLDELVELTLSGDALPSDNPIARREIELNRLQYALKACLRNKKLGAAVKLALRGGVETAGHSRQETLIRNNPDLASIFLDVDILEDCAARGLGGSDWFESHYAYEASLLSHKEELFSDARSKLRMAHDGIRAWGGLSDEKRERESITNSDIFMLAQAAYNLSGAEECVWELRRWTPRSVSYFVSRRLARWLIDSGRYADVDDLVRAAGNDIFFVLGVNTELRSAQRCLPQDVLPRALRLAESKLIKLELGNGWRNENTPVHTITAFVESLIRGGVGTTERWLRLINRHLPDYPPRGLVSQYERHICPLMKAYALRAELLRECLSEQDLAHPDLIQEFEAEAEADSNFGELEEFKAKKACERSTEFKEFRNEMNVLLPLVQAWSRGIVRGELILDETPSIPSQADGGANNSWLRNKAVLLWFDVIGSIPEPPKEAGDAFFKRINESDCSLFIDTLISICRGAARIPAFNEYAYQYVGLAKGSIEKTREDAESRTDHMVKIARAILAIDVYEAKILFEAAVDIAGKFGDEIRDRWIALLDLADHSSCPIDEAPELAYRFARAAELILDYSDESNFDWKGVIASLSRICPRSTMAITSRWRDRDIGYPLDQLRFASDSMVEAGVLKPADVLPLICIQTDWDVCAMAEKALAECGDSNEAEDVVRFVFKYLRLNDQLMDVWNRFAELIMRYEISVPDIEVEIRAFQAIPEAPVRSYNQHARSTSSPKVEAQSDPLDRIAWNELNLCTTQDLQVAYQEFQGIRKEKYLSEGHFYQAVYSRIGHGQEVDFIRAFSEAACVSFYDLKYFFDHIPERWLARASIKRELKGVLSAIVRRHCFLISRNRTFDHFPLSAICARCDIDIEPLIDEVLESIGHSPDLASAGRLFSLVGFIAPKLTASQTNEALILGISAIEEVAEDLDGDGAWRPELLPPPKVEACFASYLWGCLSAPNPSLRWQAVHVVRGLCRLTRTEVLDCLVECARGNISISSFTEKRFHFYEFHALQWFLIALARAAEESPDLVAHCSDFLLEQVSEQRRHLMVRHYAKQALESLLSAGLLHESHRELLSGVNQPLLPVARDHSKDELIAEGSGMPEGTGSLHFGIDFEPYWFSPLGRCFAQSPQAISTMASAVIREEWRIGEGLKYAEDQRAKMEIYRYPETGHSHGTYPKVDDLSFYLSYHAMMVVGSKLLETVPLCSNDDDELYEFSRWLRRHDVTQSDGAWLFDRRDPFPFNRPAWMLDTESHENWQWSVKRDDFAEVLFEDNGRLNLWGHWNWTRDDRDEVFSVTSGVVPQDRSEALLRALQTASNPSDFYVPDVGDDREIISGDYQLLGWVDALYCDSGIDEFDPWGAKISYPVPAPARYVRERLGLESDGESRVWQRQQDGAPVHSLWAQTWKREGRHRDDIDEGGSRLQASLPFVLSLLQEFQQDMIVEVQISRKLRRPSYSNKLYDHQYVPSNSKLFLIKTSGEIITI